MMSSDGDGLRSKTAWVDIFVGLGFKDFHLELLKTIIEVGGFEFVLNGCLYKLNAK